MWVICREASTCHPYKFFEICIPLCTKSTGPIKNATLRELSFVMGRAFFLSPPLVHMKKFLKGAWSKRKNEKGSRNTEKCKGVEKGVKNAQGTKNWKEQGTRLEAVNRARSMDPLDRCWTYSGGDSEHTQVVLSAQMHSIVSILVVDNKHANQSSLCSSVPTYTLVTM